jgi:hypothetical protein
LLPPTFVLVKIYLFFLLRNVCGCPTYYTEFFCITSHIGELYRKMQINTTEQKKKKLLDRVRDTIRVKHYSYQTEKTYVQWIRRYILFHNKRHHSEINGEELNTFLTYLAVDE